MYGPLYRSDNALYGFIKAKLSLIGMTTKQVVSLIAQYDNMDIKWIFKRCNMQNKSWEHQLNQVSDIGNKADNTGKSVKLVIKSTF